MFCNMCGKQIPDGSKFCPACGAQQGGEAAPQAPQGAWVSPEPQGYQGQWVAAGGSGYQNGYQNAPVPQNAPKKKKIWIPILAAVLVVVIAIAVVAAIFIIKGQRAKKQAEALTNYINVDLAALESAKDQLSNQVNGILYGGWNYEYGSMEVEMNITIQLSRQLIADANEVAASVEEDDELAFVHAVYVAFAEKCVSMTERLEDSLEDESESVLRSLKNLMEEARVLYGQFQQALADLADERDVRYRINSELPFEDILAYLNEYFS